MKLDVQTSTRRRVDAQKLLWDESTLTARLWSLTSDEENFPTKLRADPASVGLVGAKAVHQ